MTQWIGSDPQKCTACHRCEIACAMAHHGTCRPELARIRIHCFDNPGFNVPVVCMACEDAPCIKVCPVNARIREQSGSVVTDTDRCIGCRACVYICPVASPAVNPHTGQTMTCDLCREQEDGPWCVAACRIEGALWVDDGTRFSSRSTRVQAGRVRSARYVAPGGKVRRRERMS